MILEEMEERNVPGIQRTATALKGQRTNERDRTNLCRPLALPPHYGLWASVDGIPDKGCILCGQICQDIIRASNQTFGQRIVDQEMGSVLHAVYEEACRATSKRGWPMKVIDCEYNSVFFVTTRLPLRKELDLFQRDVSSSVYKAVSAFYDRQRKQHPHLAERIDATAQTFVPEVASLTVGVAVFRDGGEPFDSCRAKNVTRCAVAATAAAKLARATGTGWSFANPKPLIQALNNYRRILERHQHVYHDGIPFVETARHHLSLNPKILVESRAGRLEGEIRDIVGEAVSYLNCLDWVQPSRFADIPTLCEEAKKSAELIEDLRLRQPDAIELEVFARKNMKYFAMAQEISRHDATLFWIDLKKLGVRCHMIREAVAFDLLEQAKFRRHTIGDIVDAMIYINDRVQDIRGTLPELKGTADKFLSHLNISANIHICVGGDDAALLVDVEGRTLQGHVANALAHTLAESTGMMRVGYSNVFKGADLDEEMGRVDRSLERTKID
jgi:hypothetical protein